jgi:hypothetical protein
LDFEKEREWTFSGTAKIYEGGTPINLAKRVPIPISTCD